jgi:hypothetical protein
MEPRRKSTVSSCPGGWRGRVVVKFASLFLVLGFVLFASGCVLFKAKKAGEQAVSDFHRLYNGGKFTEIYVNSHPELKSASTEKQFLEFLDTMQRNLGKVKDTSQAGYDVGASNHGTTVALGQDTTFEHGAGREEFTFKMDGEKAVLAGYNIRSKELVPKRRWGGWKAATSPIPRPNP